ncbi:exported hypothetical protein [Candidatus Sulfotelmatomonas gaucii]|uniref:Secreted protein n=1 Tax=Candidatus Sulfuritelmatomonas gaucii TaxID=2043161 RepID=A0A2N9LQC7_9BACT|nr:exported hypothetical protein [Candidatus Sulfotelmatomonas gaucii]
MQLMWLVILALSVAGAIGQGGATASQARAWTPTRQPDRSPALQACRPPPGSEINHASFRNHAVVVPDSQRRDILTER